MQAMINPGIWYRPDSLIVMPQEDSVLWTDEYTVFTVMRSTNNESECLWSFKGNDTVSVAVLTNGFYSSKTGIIRSNNARDFSKWCVFSFHSGIILDNNKQYKLCLGEQYVYTDSMAVDTLHSQIEMEEFAFFKGNVPKLTAHTFQSYLALKYGVTLDYAPYISSMADTFLSIKALIILRFLTTKYNIFTNFLVYLIYCIHIIRRIMLLILIILRDKYPFARMVPVVKSMSMMYLAIYHRRFDA